MKDLRTCWLPIHLMTDIEELERLQKTEEKLGDQELAKIELDYLNKLKKQGTNENQTQKNGKV